MSPKEEMEMFARLGGRFEQWLDEQLQEQVKYLVSAVDPAMLRRAQGAAAFIENMKKSISKAKTL